MCHENVFSFVIVTVIGCKDLQYYQPFALALNPKFIALLYIHLSG